jgi:hypothetical protein
MAESKRILIAILILVVIAGVVLGFDALQRRTSPTSVAAGEPTLAPGSVPIYLKGELAGSFAPDDLDQLEQVSFVDAEEGKKQEGWLLRDVLLLHLEQEAFEQDTLITVFSTSRGRSAQLTWAEVHEPGNKVLFDLSGRGTLKIVSVLDKLDTRDEWVQDVDKIEVGSQQ